MKYLSRVLKEEFMGFETIILVNDKTKTEGHKNDVRTFINFTKKHDIMFVKKEKVDDETYKVYFRYFTDEERERSGRRPNPDKEVVPRHPLHFRRTVHQ